MPSARLRLALLLPAALLLALAGPSPTAADELVRVVSSVAYDVRPDAGAVHVSWRVNVENNDPQTAPSDSGTVSFYDSLPVPVLRGAATMSALSPAGAPLFVSVDESAGGPIAVANVGFDTMLFYRETYSFTLDYDLPSAREESLLVTPYYIFLPLIASGDESTVTLSAPDDGIWDVELEKIDCAQDGTTFSCAGPDSVHLAAFAEISRPDATASIPFDVALANKDLSVTLTYFQGEEVWARHVQGLAAAALPVIEELYGFAYPGPFAVNIAERGRQVILGYEGLTSCKAEASCDISVSPIADDFTVLHELAHLWSDIYSKRWLAEGFAEFLSLEAADHMPSSLFKDYAPVRAEPPVALRLDEWRDVTSITAASPEERQIEDAGYELSLRFLTALRDEVGLQALQEANAQIAGGEPADSRRFMDTLEYVSEANLDGLFGAWVFPDSFGPTLAARRQARERLRDLTARAHAENLSADVPTAIQVQVEAWEFDQALGALDRAEAALAIYAEVKPELQAFRAEVIAAALPLPESMDVALARWDFEAVRLAIASGRRGLEAYTTAREKADAPRSVWERLGLLGRDPDDSLKEAAAAFGRGDFQQALDKADAAAHAVNSASRVALIRVLIALGVLVGGAGLVTVAVRAARRRRPKDYVLP